jgi:RNAse (barnase) inhibitor barstar
VAVFDPDAGLAGDIAFELVADTFVRLFWQPAVLQQVVEQLGGQGYQIVTVDAAGWTTAADLHHDLATALSFPDYYGANLDALNDCLRDVAEHAYGASPTATGLVLVLTNYDRFASSHPQVAHALLDIFAAVARSAALIGHRMCCLIHSNNPDIQFPPVGATPILWNDAEWLDTSRHPDP